MRVLVTGGAGTVGSALLRSVPAGVTAEATVFERPGPPGVRVHRVDLAEPGAVSAVLAAASPDVVIHTAYRQDDRRAIVDATAEVARACASAGCGLIHLSTDVVFGGDRPPYGEDDEPSPISDYGRWKLEAEGLALDAVPDATITRTSLVLAHDPPDRYSAGLLAGVAAGRTMRLYEDEWRQPIHVEDLVAILWAITARPDRAGLWHLPGPERLNRRRIGELIVARVGGDTSLLEAGSVADHPEPRPADLTMRTTRPVALPGRPRPVAEALGVAGGERPRR